MIASRLDLPAVDPVVADAKERRLLDELARLPGCIVAFSGGVDSSYVAWAAHRALGARARAFTAVSPSLARSLRAQATRVARAIGIEQVEIATGEADDPRYAANDRDRCYWCKAELYDRLERIRAAGAGAIVLDGTNADDVGDHRPGRRAAGERGVRSPLLEHGLGKVEIRWLSQRAGLETWDRPASPCLSSRVPYGRRIDAAMLATIDRAEEGVRALGFREFRVRHLGERARLEVAAEELPRALEAAVERRLEAAMVAAGFAAATVDREPFRSGRLNDESS